MAAVHLPLAGHDPPVQPPSLRDLVADVGPAPWGPAQLGDDR